VNAVLINVLHYNQTSFTPFLTRRGAVATIVKALGCVGT